MKTLKTEHFLDSIESYQMLEFTTELNKQMKDVLPCFNKNCKQIDYLHFLGIRKGYEMMYLSADTQYFQKEKVVTRNIRSIRIYENELMMEFYMMLHEYENSIDPNPILFN